MSELNKIIQGDCLDIMRDIPDNFVDLVVTDCPYGLSFMGKDWDKAVPSVDVWKECLRVLKDGAFAFVMCIPRQDCLSRMIVNLSDAGFDTGFTSIYWTYASGFPKAGNISKMIDKRGGKYMGWFADYLKNELEKRKIKQKELATHFPSKTGGLTGCVHNWIEGKNIPTPKQFNKICEVLKLPFENIQEVEREVIGKDKQKGNIGYENEDYSFEPKERLITIPATAQAKSLDGSYSGFQPKPSVEIIIVAMKPLSEKTYVDQVLKNKKGITWLDDCRVPYQSDVDKELSRFGTQTDIKGNAYGINRPSEGHVLAKNVLSSEHGRFPANLLVSDDVLNDGIDRHPTHANYNDEKYDASSYHINYSGNRGYTDSGSFSRYFDLDAWWHEHFKKLPKEVQKVFPFLIVPKASKSEKNKGCKSLKPKIQKTAGKGLDNTKRRCPIHNKPIPSGVNAYSCGCSLQFEDDDVDRPKKNFHPTVKPLVLTNYLLTLGSRKGDIILDPFVGSGTTCISAKMLLRKYIGIEINQEYVDIAKARLRAVPSIGKWL